MQATKTYVIAGHINETYFVYQQKLKEFDPIGFINFENLSLNDAAHKRLGNMNGPYHGLIRWLYRDDIICKLFETKQQNIFTINTSELFEPDITKLLTRLNQDLGLDLDLDFCIRLHNKWYKKIIQ
jgi:hypothetical protein